MIEMINLEEPDDPLKLMPSIAFYRLENFNPIWVLFSFFSFLISFRQVLENLKSIQYLDLPEIVSGLKKFISLSQSSPDALKGSEVLIPLIDFIHVMADETPNFK